MKRTLIVAALTAILTVTASASDWWQNISVKGDLRYRHEMLKSEGDDARHRQRLRARVAVLGKVSEQINATVQLATGSEDPVSTNQTLGDAFSTKRIGLDLAFFEITPVPTPGLTLVGGKFHNPFFKPGSSELIWDSDFTPEGGVANYQAKWPGAELELIGAGLWIEERSKGKDSWLGAAQGVLTLPLAEGKTKLAFGGAFFNYVNVAGFPTFFDAEDAFGNSIDTLGQYLNDYELVEGYVEITHEFPKFPVTLMADFVNNTAADSLNTGWLVGIRAGKTSKPGSVSFRYIYRQLEADAVVGLFTDSDFRGGGTDAKGHEIGGSLQVAKNATFDVTFFDNKIGLDKAESGFQRLQVDLQLKFK
ncbi:MAG: putative porin [bacterium]